MKLLPTAAAALVDKGVPFVEATYVSHSVETINARQKGTETKKEMKILRHLLHRGSKAFIVDDWLPEGFKEENLRVTFKAGQTICIELTGIEREGPGFMCRGTMTLVADAPKG